MHKTGTTTKKANHMRKAVAATGRRSRPKAKARSPEAVYASNSSQIGKIGKLING